MAQPIESSTPPFHSALGLNRAKPSQAWLISFADMVTLLLIFFILAMTILKEMEKNLYKEVEHLLSETIKQLQSYVIENNLEAMLSVERSTKGVHLTISSGALFESGNATIKETVKPVLNQIAKAIANADLITDPDNRILQRIANLGKKVTMEVRIEGHTDDIPIKTAEFPSNWELSSARALSVLKHIQSASKLPANIFTASGYSEYKPLVPNTSEKNRSRNRRVEIYVDAEVTPKNNRNRETERFYGSTHR